MRFFCPGNVEFPRSSGPKDRPELYRSHPTPTFAPPPPGASRSIGRAFVVASRDVLAKRETVTGQIREKFYATTIPMHRGRRRRRRRRRERARRAAAEKTGRRVAYGR